MSEPTRAGAPETEIEITPQMLAAGIEEYLAVWTDLRDAKPGAKEAMLCAAYRAMARRVLRP